MNRRLLLAGIGIGILLFLGVGLWTYVFFGDSALPIENPFGAANDREFPAAPTENAGETEGALPALARHIRQISTRKAGGIVAIERDGATYLRFAELGTGHLYEAPLVGGAETRISNTTYPKTRDAVFAESGTRVALTYENDDRAEIVVGSITVNDSGSSALADTIALPTGSHSVGFNDIGDTLYYAVSSETETIGYERSLKTAGSPKTLFNVPLSAVGIDWSPSPLIVTRPAALRGSAYDVDLTRVATGQSGFVAERIEAGVIATARSGSAVASAIVGATSTIPLFVAALPEKCGGSGVARIICAVPRELEARDFPLAWYRGEIAYDDVFYTIDPRTGSTTRMLDPYEEARRSVDAIDVESIDADRVIVFINRTDSTPWVLMP